MTTVHNIKQMADTIYHEAINNSTANQKYSFPKNKRFSNISTGITPTDFTVNLNSTFGRRSPSFGFGDRFK